MEADFDAILVEGALDDRIVGQAAHHRVDLARQALEGETALRGIVTDEDDHMSAQLDQRSGNPGADEAVRARDEDVC